MSKKSVLVTGASSGLGHAAALMLARKGFHVFAAAREIRGVFNGQANVEEVRLDITDDESVAQALKKIAAKNTAYPLWGLINNAGICVPSPLEMLNPQELRRQLDTNVIGQLQVTQAMLPLLRENQGRIINITSGLGSIAVPYLGAYSIAQFAKMAFTDALRRELASSGVTVSVVQPGAIYTPIWDKFLATGQEILDQVSGETRQIYARSFTDFLKRSEALARVATTSETDFAEVILEVLTTQQPLAQYSVGDDAQSFVDMAKSATTAELDTMFAAQMPTKADFVLPQKIGQAS